MGKRFYMDLSNMSNLTAARAWAQIQMDRSELRLKPRCEQPLSHASSQGSQESQRGEF